MTWEAVTALSALASAIIVAVAALAAIMQIRHLRTGNQLEAILRIYETFNSREMVDARRFCLHEFAATLPDHGSLRQLSGATIDPRVTLVANFHNEIGALVVDKFLDERLAWPLVPLTARLWQTLAPLAAAWRAQQPDPVWADFEYLASLDERVTRDTHIGRYPPAFRARLRAELAELNDQTG